MAGLSSGTTSDLPTWQYVQQVVQSNISKSEDAIAVAQGYLSQIAAQYGDIQNDISTDWSVDIGVGTDTRIAWSNSVDGGKTPVEPDYLVAVPEPVTAPETDLPGGIKVQPQPDWDLSLGGVPDTPETLPYSSLPTLGPLPVIEVPIPSLDIGVLDTEFSFTEGPYEVQVSEEAKADILRALGGDLGIPQAYWDDLWAKTSGDLAEQQAGLARNARNRGAATHWGLPTEAVLVASRAAQDEGNKKLQFVRLEQAQKQAELAHADFWKAIESAAQFEKVWIDFHNQVQTRALAAAQHLASTAVQIYNANVAGYNALLEAAKTSTQVLTLEIEATIKRYEAQLQQNRIEIEQNKGVIDVFSAEVQAYSVSQSTQIQAIAEQTKAWDSQWKSHIGYQQLKQEKYKLDITNYSALLSKIDTVAKATASVLSARTGASAQELKGQMGVLEQDKVRNAANLDVSRLTQSAQEASAKLQTAQMQWLGGQGNALLQSLTQSAIGLAQALVTVSDVNLGSSASASDSSSVSASRNAERVW